MEFFSTTKIGLGTPVAANVVIRSVGRLAVDLMIF